MRPFHACARPQSDPAWSVKLRLLLATGLAATIGPVASAGAARLPDRLVVESITLAATMSSPDEMVMEEGSHISHRFAFATGKVSRKALPPAKDGRVELGRHYFPLVVFPRGGVISLIDNGALAVTKETFALQSLGVGQTAELSGSYGSKLRVRLLGPHDMVLARVEEVTRVMPRLTVALRGLGLHVRFGRRAAGQAHTLSTGSGVDFRLVQEVLRVVARFRIPVQSVQVQGGRKQGLRLDASADGEPRPPLGPHAMKRLLDSSSAAEFAQAAESAVKMRTLWVAAVGEELLTPGDLSVQVGRREMGVLAVDRDIAPMTLAIGLADLGLLEAEQRAGLANALQAFIQDLPSGSRVALLASTSSGKHRRLRYTSDGGRGLRDLARPTAPALPKLDGRAARDLCGQAGERIGVLLLGWQQGELPAATSEAVQQVVGCRGQVAVLRLGRKPSDDAWLRAVAEGSGGVFEARRNVASVGPALEALTREWQRRYRVTYFWPEAEEPHDIRLSAKRPGLELRELAMVRETAEP